MVLAGRRDYEILRISLIFLGILNLVFCNAPCDAPSMKNPGAWPGFLEGAVGQKFECERMNDRCSIGLTGGPT